MTVHLIRKDAKGSPSGGYYAAPGAWGGDGTYADPEFTGTWKKNEEICDTGLTIQNSNLTVFERKSLQRAKEQHRLNMTHPQVLGFGCGKHA